MATAQVLIDSGHITTVDQQIQSQPEIKVFEPNPQNFLNTPQPGIRYIPTENERIEQIAKELRLPYGIDPETSGTWVNTPAFTYTESTGFTFLGTTLEHQYNWNTSGQISHICHLRDTPGLNLKSDHIITYEYDEFYRLIRSQECDIRGDGTYGVPYHAKYYAYPTEKSDTPKEITQEEFFRARTLQTGEELIVFQNELRANSTSNQSKGQRLLKKILPWL